MSERHQTVEYWREKARVAEAKNARLREREQELLSVIREAREERDRLREENEYMRVKTTQYDRMVTEVEILLAALRRVEKFTAFDKPGQLIQDICREAIAEVEGRRHEQSQA